MTAPSRDRGFTLLEVLVTISLLGTLMAIAVSGWSSWAKASAHSGTADEIQSVLRHSHQRAVAEGESLCVWFDVPANTYSVYRGTCGARTTQVSGPHRTASPEVSIVAPQFGPANEAGVTMEPRGTAYAGSVLVTRTGSSKEYRLTVDRLTSRVTLS